MIPVRVAIDVTYTKIVDLEFDGDKDYIEEELEAFVEESLDREFSELPTEVGDYESSEWDWREI